MEKLCTVLKTYNDNYNEIYTYYKRKPNLIRDFLNDMNVTDPREIERISLSRTRRNVREIALCNDFEFFSTITVNSVNCDRFSLTACQTLLKSKIKRIKRTKKDFKYIFITEKHKNGAFHFHGLMTDTGDLYINDNGYLSSYTFDEVGYNSHSIIKDYNKCCNYITKYITKECVKNDTNQIYISSRGLKKAEKQDIKTFDITDLPNFYENDYLAKVSYSFNDLTLDQKLKILQNWS